MNNKNLTKSSKRIFLKNAALTGVGLFSLFLPVAKLQAKTFLSVEQAKKILFPGKVLNQTPVALSKEQKKTIQKASKVRVRSLKINAWTTENGDWFILDQIIGKHENIDMAFAFDNNGKVLGLEILTYRESYGHEIMNKNWRAQFTGKDNSERLKLDKQIKNISGATLSCRHVTDGINRLAHTWDLVLKHKHLKNTDILPREFTKPL